MDPKVVIVVSAVIFFIIVFGFLFRFILIYNRKVMRITHEKELLREGYERESLKSELEIREQTLKMISQEMHDNIGQMMILVKLHLNAISLQEPEDALKRLAELNQLVPRIIQDIRDLSRSLDPDLIVAIGFENVFCQELKSLEKSGLLKCNTYVGGERIAIDPGKELIVFRILQEALQNALKHSAATLLQFNVHFSDQGCLVSLSDNGKGFDASNGSQDGNGLKNISNRARLIDAQLKLQSSPGNGTYLELIFK